MEGGWRSPRTSRYLLPVRARRFALVVGVAALFAAACSGDPGHPTTLPSLSATHSPSVSTTPTSSDLEAATQVVREYYTLLNHLAMTMDARGIGALMTSTCGCREQLTAIENARSKGQHFIDHVELVSLTPVRDTPIEVSVLVEYNAARGGLVDSSGHPVTTSKARRGVKRLFRLAFETNRWLIADIGAA